MNCFDLKFPINRTNIFCEILNEGREKAFEMSCYRIMLKIKLIQLRMKKLWIGLEKTGLHGII